jgi:regulator of nucleoside diphosphate kinase
MLDHDNDLIITTTDFARLQPVLDTHDSRVSELLDLELHRARVVEPRAVPADVVTMNSDVIYEDCDTLERRAVRVCYPRDANAAAGRVSVLAPIGSALLGLRAGQSITLPLPHGRKRVRVVEIRYQPEASGDFHL